jgi:hypothetical protein
LSGAVSRIPGLDDRFERFPFVLHVPFDDFDQIRDQVVASFQLHVDLGESVFEFVLRGDKAVVTPDEVQREQQNDDTDSDQE